MELESQRGEYIQRQKALLEQAHALRQRMGAAEECVDSTLTFPDLHERAWNLAAEPNRPTAYDAPYLALAEILVCEFWTADKRLYQAVQSRLPWVCWLGTLG